VLLGLPSIPFAKETEAHKRSLPPATWNRNMIELATNHVSILLTGVYLGTE